MYQADSRLIQEGDTFFALPGAKTDGHAFLEEVSRKGAKVAYVKTECPSYGMKLIKVSDPLLALQELAREKIKKFKGKIIAVTGSVGKTTTKEFIAQILSTKYKVCSTKKSQNTKITLPLTILNDLQGDEDFLVLEMGMTHPGDIGKLVSIAPPDIAVLTQVTFVHAVNFSSYEEIYRNKCEIFSSPRTQVKIRMETLVPYQGPLHLPGEHTRLNLAAAIEACKACGMTEIDITHLNLPEKRLELVEKKGITFLNDSYNACWLSMKGAIDALTELKQKKKMAILGDMKEQGSWSQEMHQKVLDYAETKVEKLFLLGPEWSQTKLPPKAISFKDKKELVLELQKSLSEGDAILIKGSNSHQLWTLLEEV